MRRRRRGASSEYVDPSLIARWTFNESDNSGTTVTDVIGGFNGTSANAINYTVDQNNVANQSMVFNGSTDLVTTTFNPNTTLGSSDFTISAFVDFTDVSGTPSVIGAVTTSNRFYIRSEASGKIVVGVGGSGQIGTVEDLFEANVWTRVDVVYDASEKDAHVYSNGIFSETLSSASFGGTLQTVLLVGDGTRELLGNISLLEIYNEAKDADWVYEQWQNTYTESANNAVENGDFTSWDGVKDLTDWEEQGETAGKYVEENASGCRFVSDGSGFYIQQPNALIKTHRYKATIDIDTATDGDITIRIGTTASAVIGTTGKTTIEAVADNGAAWIVTGADTPVDMIISSISYIDLTPYATIPPRIVLMGNSIFNRNSGYLYLDADFGNDAQAHDSAIGGDNTTQMLARFQTDVLDVDDVEEVVILAGINDVIEGSSAASIQTNLQSMYTQAANAGLTVHACYITPCKEYLEDNYAATAVAKQAVIDAVNTWIGATATDCDSKIDTYTAMEDDITADYIEADYDSGDHLHPNATGSDALMAYIFANANWSYDD